MSRSVLGVRQSVVIKIVVFITTIILLVIGGAGAYRWYLQHNDAPPMSTTYSAVASTPKEDAAAKAVAEETNEAKISFRRFTSVAAPGKEVVVIAQTTAGAECRIKFEYGDKKVVAADPSATPRKADKDGAAAWRWKLAQGTPAGKWPVTVACSGQDGSGQIVRELKVTEPRTTGATS